LILLLVGAAAASILVDGREAERLVAANATVLDTRDLVAYTSGHVPAAIRVDWRIGVVGGLTSGKLGDPALLAEAFAALGVDGQRPVLVVGGWEAEWGEEGRIAWDLAWLGHDDVHVLSGGMASWEGPTARAAGVPTTGHFVARPREELRATIEEVRAGAGLLVDVREAAEYGGANPYFAARGGVIPGAVSRPWRDLVGSMPDLPRARPLIVYCVGGVRSGLAWAWLTDHGYDVANYDGSWWEWARVMPAL